MKLLTGQEFAALVDKAGLSARQVSAAVECSHVTIYNYLKGAVPPRSRFLLWAFTHFLRESLYYNLLPLKDIDKHSTNKVITLMFGEWLVQRIEFQTKELRAGRNLPTISLGEGELSMDVESEQITL